MPNEAGIALQVEALRAHYGDVCAVDGVSLHVREGEVVALVGHNGAGKTTTLRSITGLLRSRQGSIRVRGVETLRMPPHLIARLGLAYCPEERAIFSELSVQENLMLPPRLKQGGMSMDEIFALFPNLTGRLANRGTMLSGGEQQMLALARILRTGADVLLLDEVTEGLAPIIVQEIERVLQILKSRGATMVIVEQNLAFTRGLADRFYVYASGKISASLDNTDENFEKIKRMVAI